MASDTPAAAAALEFLKRLIVTFRPEVATAHQKDLERAARLHTAIAALRPTDDDEISGDLERRAERIIDAVAMSDLRAAATECANGLFIGIPIHLRGSWEVPMVLYNCFDHPITWIAHSGTSVAADEDTGDVPVDVEIGGQALLTLSL